MSPQYLTFEQWCYSILSSCWSSLFIDADCAIFVWNSPSQKPLIHIDLLLVVLFFCSLVLLPPPSPFTFSHHHYFRWFMNHVIISSSYKTNKQKEMSSLTKYRCHLSQNTDVISHKIQMSSLTKFRCHLLQMSLSLYSYFYFFLLTCLWFIFCFLFDERQYLLIQYKFH